MTDPQPIPRRPSLIRAMWRRFRLYLWTALLGLAILIYGGVVLIRHQPARVLAYVQKQLPFPSTVEKIYWLDDRRLELDNVKLGDFFYADSIVITVDVYQLLRHHITAIEVTGGQLYTQPLNQVMTQKGSGQPGLDWTIIELTVRRATLMLDNVAPHTSLPIRLGVKSPIILNYIKLGKPDSSYQMTRERVQDIENVNLVSPFDPLAPVLAFPLTRVRFTYAELWAHHIREIDFVRPTIFLGQDLFWFTDQFKQNEAAAPAQGIDAPWQVAHLEVQYGQLAINAFGQPAVHFPFFFETKVDDIRLDQLDKLSARSTIAIRSLNQEYPDYKVRIVNLHGRLDFSIPPTNAKANNVVPTVFIDELSWNDIAATAVTTSVTFDPTGIYGKLTGRCEKGLVTGNFEVYYTKGFTWNGNLFANQIDCQPIAEKMAGKYFDLTGSLDGKIAVQGKATEILNCQGDLELRHPGLLQIHSMDDLLKRLPADTAALKRKALQIAIDTFRSYPYRNGMLKIAYQPSGGLATLHLDSPNGKRDFAIAYHPYESSKVANANDNQ